ncbi:MAG TPA: hypothetical protein VM305_02125 [Candidatus Limnocylindrales bacterium]|nr:hypothetical protein [Candidatus Limnocylindrales bacterium]
MTLFRPPNVRDLLRKAQEPSRAPQRPARQQQKRAPAVVDLLNYHELFAARRERIPGRLTGQSPLIAPTELIGAAAEAMDHEVRQEAGRLLAAHAPYRMTGVTPGEPPARGQAAIVGRVARAGYTWQLTPDREAVAVTSRDGRSTREANEAIALVTPFLLADARSEVLRCAFCDEPAWTIALGGAVVCEGHLA